MNRRSNPSRSDLPAPGQGGRVPENTATPETATSRGRLLKPETSCPRCGSRPALRLSEDVAHVLRYLARGTRLGTYQCQRRGCGAIYDLMTSDCVADQP